MNLLKPQDIADRLQLSKRHVAEVLTYKDSFPKAFKISGVRRWDKSEVEEWIKKQR